MAYILAPQRLAVGDNVVAGKKVDVKPGNAMELGQMPVGTIVHNVEMKPGKGGQIARAGRHLCPGRRPRPRHGHRPPQFGRAALHPLRIAWARSARCRTPTTQNQNFAKAGRTRWMGKRPLTRGVAKNPVDHPHGGGEGRTSGGRHPVTPWGKPTKGARTRHNKSTDKMIIRSRHAKKKR